MGSMTFTFMETEEIKITSLDWTATGGVITVNILNTGTTDVTVVGGTCNGVDSVAAIDTTITKGSTNSVSITGATFEEGTSYNIQLLTSKGNKFSYTTTATVDSA
jgi:hypothetical protein